MVTVPGIYLNGSLEPENLYMFIDPTDRSEDGYGKHWCYWSSLLPEGSIHTAATFGSSRIVKAELIYPCNSFIEAKEIFYSQYPELFI